MTGRQICTRNWNSSRPACTRKSQRRRRDACDHALSGLRQLIRSMRRGDDLSAVTVAVGGCLDHAGIRYHAYGINFIQQHDHEPRLTQVLRTTCGARAIHVKNLRLGSPVAQSWQEGVVVYRPDLLADDPNCELDAWARDAAPAPRRSIIDVPFSHGTLAINSLEANAFSDFDINCLQCVAEVLTEPCSAGPISGSWKSATKSFPGASKRGRGERRTSLVPARFWRRGIVC